MENDIKNDKELYSYFVQRNVNILSNSIIFYRQPSATRISAICKNTKKFDYY